MSISVFHASTALGGSGAAVGGSVCERRRGGGGGTGASARAGGGGGAVAAGGTIFVGSSVSGAESGSSEIASDDNITRGSGVALSGIGAGVGGSVGRLTAPGGGGGGTELLRSRAPNGRAGGWLGGGSWVWPVSGSTSTSAVGSRDDFGGRRSAMGPLLYRDLREFKLDSRTCRLSPARCPRYLPGHTRCSRGPHAY